MRLVLFSLAVLALAACGVATTAPGSSGEAPTLAQPTVSTGTEEPEVKPPPVVLISSAGKQSATLGSFCITGQGVGQCADAAGPIVPEAMTVVQPGDNVIVVIPGATLGKDSSVTIRPLGCVDEETETLALPESGELHWSVDLEHGAYQLDVFAAFATADGWSGDVSGTLGLTVAGPKQWDALGVGPVEPDMEVCSFGE